MRGELLRRGGRNQTPAQAERPIRDHLSPSCNCTAPPRTVSLQSLQTNRIAFMDQFIATAGTLQSISEKELSHTELAAEEVTFLENVIEDQTAYVSGFRKYTGWYPALFYRPARQFGDWGLGQGSDFSDPLVTDVHTDTFDAVHGDPGSILHEGVGNVYMAFVVADCGGTNLTMYAGPVLSHYEFELGPTTRMTDSQWQANVLAGVLPPQPDWTRGFLVPYP